MENTVLERVYGRRCTQAVASNGYVCTEEGIAKIESGEKMCAGPAGRQIIAFYADAKKGVYKAVCASGEMARCSREEGYAWEVEGVFEQSAVRHAAYNEANGNLLVVAGKDVYLVDRNAELVKQVQLDDSAQGRKESGERERACAEWSADGKYILLLVDTVVHTYGYDLSAISNTWATTNRVMNSRLMRTKKYVAHESAYTDVARRVQMPDDPEQAAAEQQDSVLFEARAKYKHASWHGEHDLIVGVTSENKVQVLERSCLRYKEIQHVREKDRDRECMQENSIDRVCARGDYVYMAHREGERTYIKVYYVKNNTVYLKASQCVSERGAEAVRYMYVSEGIVHIGTTQRVMGLRHRRVTNRTAEGVVEVDGARILTYELARRLAPPPFFTRYDRICGVPARVRCTSRGISSIDERGREEVVWREGKGEEAGEEEDEYSTELPGEIDGKEMRMQGARVRVSYRDSTLRIAREGAEVMQMQGVTSVYMLRAPAECLLVTKETLAYAELHTVGCEEAGQSVSSRRIARSAKGNRIVFATDTSVILVTEYGTLETYYPEFLVRHKMRMHAAAGELQQAVRLAQRHGTGIEDISGAVLQAVGSRQGMEAALLFAVTKIYLAKESEENGKRIAAIEQAIRDRLESRQEDIEVLMQGVSIGQRRAESEDTGVLCSVLTEIHLARAEYAQAVRLASRYAPAHTFSPLQLERAGAMGVAECILRRVLKVTGKEQLMTQCMSAYAYALCYLLCSITGSPVDEVNSVLLGPDAVAGEAVIDTENMREETERRYRVAVLTSNKGREVVYTIKRAAAGTEKSGQRGEAHEEAAEKVAKQLEARHIRNFCDYLLAPSRECREDEEHVQNKEYARMRDAVLCVAGEMLRREQALDTALQCFAAAGEAGKERARQLQLHLGRWQELLANRENVTEQNMAKLEQVLRAQKRVREAAMMQMQHGSRALAIGLLMECREYAEICEMLACDGAAASALQHTLLVQQVDDYAVDIGALHAKYVEHRDRLARVRERKNRQREDMLQGEYVDDGCDSTVCSTRSFVTNTFMAGAEDKKTRRPAKLRNTVNGRYEEEYVQYVLGEIVRVVGEQAGQVRAIEQICRYVGREQEAAAAKDRWAGRARDFLHMLLPHYDSDFLCRNTEDDPLYDPNRPVIPQPALSAIQAYLGMQ